MTGCQRPTFKLSAFHTDPLVMATRKIKLKNTKNTAGTILKELRRINRDADTQACSGLGNNKNRRR